MYDFHLLVLEAVVKARHQDWKEEVERLHALKLVGATKPRFADRALTNIGKLLTSAGNKLQERYAPVASSASKACQSGC